MSPRFSTDRFQRGKWELPTCQYPYQRPDHPRGPQSVSPTGRSQVHWIREEIEETKLELQKIREHLTLLQMDVVLREPLDGELAEMREWVRERAL
jgi:hypothetical protein